jgi:7-cyano-7-deazaguanine synthase in queuosine biosynthesis
MQQYFKDNHKQFGLDINTLMNHIEGRDESRDTTEEPTSFTKRYGERSVDRIRPFINKDKQAVYHAYRDLDMMEQLYPHTYSCETIPDNYDTMDFVHCGHCFFCLERYWGFGRII